MAAPPPAPPYIPSLRSRIVTRGRLQVRAAREMWATMTGCVHPNFFELAPANVIDLIMLNLDELDRLRLGAVCVSLRRASASPQLWRHVTVRADAWSIAQIVSLIRVVTPHVRNLRVEGCGDPHTSRAFLCVVTRLMREPNGPPNELRLLEAPALVPEDTPPRKRPNGRGLIGVTAGLSDLCASHPEIRVHLGGVAPMFCLGTVDWYTAIGSKLRLEAFSDVFVTPDIHRPTDEPCIATAALPLVASAHIRTVFLTVRRWPQSTPMNVVAALMGAGVKDLRLQIAPTSGVPALPRRREEAGSLVLDLERLEFTFGGGRYEPGDDVWNAWMALPSLKHLRFDTENLGYAANDRHVKDALAALRDTPGVRLDVLDVRNSSAFTDEDSSLLEIVASENAPEEVRVNNYMSFVEDRPEALRFVRALGARVRRVVALVLDAGFALDDCYYLHAGPRPEMRPHGAVAAELVRKNIDFRFQGKQSFSYM